METTVRTMLSMLAVVGLVACGEGVPEGAVHDPLLQGPGPGAGAWLVPTGSACRVDGHCGAAPEARCIGDWPGGFCAPACDGDSICGWPLGVCAGAGSDQPGVCLLRCVYEAECRPGYGCLAGLCWPVPTVDGD